MDWDWTDAELDEAIAILDNVEVVKRVTRVKDSLCPTCQQHREIFHTHHVISRSDFKWAETKAGMNYETNLLRVCTSCHSRMSLSDELADQLLLVLATRFMEAVYGIRFLFTLSRVRKDDREIFRLLLERRIDLRQFNSALKMLARDTYAGLFLYLKHGEPEKALADIESLADYWENVVGGMSGLKRSMFQVEIKDYRQLTLGGWDEEEAQGT